VDDEQTATAPIGTGMTTASTMSAGAGSWRSTGAAGADVVLSDGRRRRSGCAIMWSRRPSGGSVTARRGQSKTRADDATRMSSVFGDYRLLKIDSLEHPLVCDAQLENRLGAADFRLGRRRPIPSSQRSSATVFSNRPHDPAYDQKSIPPGTFFAFVTPGRQPLGQLIDFKGSTRSRRTRDAEAPILPSRIKTTGVQGPARRAANGTSSATVAT